eukprot:NODE_183_length_1975_cov_50.241883_g159_i0.p1 GENE.NODE_183_length_1975_cov_50.241883_g159_i0~~NODE_183_length_1975_cov_50.241883_g159_i0.p1  ORF type:complete len:481 (+),score=106.45 NODE_183_length_1975_cov_50.241883_g159_i0:82-1524(+)
MSCESHTQGCVVSREGPAPQRTLAARGHQELEGLWSGLTHPCLAFFKNKQCAYGDRCYFADLPREWCMLCLLGEDHDECRGVEAPKHPCLRVWGSCRFGEKCAFRKYPRVWCLFCLRGAKHKTCSGLRPKALPKVSPDLLAGVADHEDKLKKREEQKMAKAARRAARKMQQECGHLLPEGEELLTLTTIQELPGQQYVHCPYGQFSVPVVAELQESIPEATIAITATPTHVLEKTLETTLQEATPLTFNDCVTQCFDAAIAALNHEDVNPEEVLKIVGAALHRAALTEESSSKLFAGITVELETRFKQQPTALKTTPPRALRLCVLAEAQRVHEKVTEVGVTVARCNMAFLGEFFTRKALGEQLLVQIVDGVLSSRSPLDVGLRVEMALAVLSGCGPALDASPKTRTKNDQWFTKLRSYKAQVPALGTAIDSMTELRQRDWAAVTHDTAFVPTVVPRSARRTPAIEQGATQTQTPISILE